VRGRRGRVRGGRRKGEVDAEGGGGNAVFRGMGMRMGR
jgi:hypothetical protein